MTDVRMLAEKAKPMKDVPELSNGLNLPKHMAEHIYMFSGPSKSIKLTATPDMMSDLVDWFGKDFRILEKGEDRLVIKLDCNESAMRFWALQYGPYVEILEPVSLRNRIKDDVAAMSKKYNS